MSARQRSLLIEEPPLQVIPGLAKEIGLNEAIILQQIHYWLGRSDNERDGLKWVYKSMQEWQDEFPFWSEPTIKRVIAKLRDLGLIRITKKSSTSWERVNWYTVDYTVLASIGSKWAGASDQSDPMQEINLTESIGSKRSDRSDQSDLITITTETTSKNTGLNGFEILWKTLPKRAGNNPKNAALVAYKARLTEGHTHAEIIDGAGRYAAFCRATGKEGTEYVLRASTFLGRDKPFTQAWAVPASRGAPWDRSNDTALAKGSEVGITPRPGESWPEFIARVREALESRVPA